MDGMWQGQQSIGPSNGADGPPDFARNRVTFSTPEPTVGHGATWWDTMFFALVATCVAAVSVLWIRYDRDFERRLDAEGTTTTGRVTRISDRQFRRVRDYYVHYEYSAGRTRYRSARKVSREEAEATDVGEAVTVTYLASDPKRHITGPMSEQRQHLANRRVSLQAVCGVLWVATAGSAVLRLAKRGSRPRPW